MKWQLHLVSNELTRNLEVYLMVISMGDLFLGIQSTSFFWFYWRRNSSKHQNSSQSEWLELEMVANPQLWSEVPWYFRHWKTARSGDYERGKMVTDQYRSKRRGTQLIDWLFAKYCGYILIFQHRDNYDEVFWLFISTLGFPRVVMHMFT